MAQPIPEVARLGEIIAASDGIILVSPEYNNSYSGALKNMVDYYTKEWYHKPMGVVAASEGKQGGINASNLMQLLILAINGFAMPTKLLVPEIAKTIDEDGKPADEQLNKQINKFVAHFVWFTAAIAAHKQKQES
jgi:NAD(P)H-dependent FMN reductase